MSPRASEATSDTQDLHQTSRDAAHADLHYHHGGRSGVVVPFRDDPLAYTTLEQQIDNAADQAALVDLIARLATRFAVFDRAAIEHGLADSLREIGQTLRLERAALWRLSADATVHVIASWHQDAGAEGDSAEGCRLPETLTMLSAGDALPVSDVNGLAHACDRDTLLREGLLSVALVPVSLPEGAVGALVIGSTTAREWTPGVVDRLRLAAGVYAQTFARRTSLDALQRAVDDLQRLRRDDRTPRGVGGQHTAPAGIVGDSVAIRRVLERAEQVARTDATVLLLGETGTGKELVAAYIHGLSARRGKTMVRLNCSALPPTLMESELFGRERGAFTGSNARQIGRFELADRSTLFLDEIGELPLDMQVKLLRVLEERQIERLGNPKPVDIDIRIIAATNRDLDKQVLDRAFREDLFYRLNVFPIQVPPLRERFEDIPLLVRHFVAEFSLAMDKRIDSISHESMSALQQYAWPGNIRELRNLVERAMIVASGPELSIALPRSGAPPAARSARMADVQRDHLLAVLESSGWRIRGAGGAADQLGLPPTTLESRMAKLGIGRPARSRQ